MKCTFLPGLTRCGTLQVIPLEVAAKIEKKTPGCLTAHIIISKIKSRNITPLIPNSFQRARFQGAPSLVQ